MVIVTAILAVAFYASTPVANKIGDISSDTVGVSSLCQNLPPVPQGKAIASIDSRTANFTMIEANDGPYMGMNGSAYYEGMGTLSSQSNSTITSTTAKNGVPWPVMEVFVGQIVNIRVVNCAPDQHGFAIANYSQPPAAGLTIPPNHSAFLTFVANKVGNFVVYEQIFSVIHSFMNNGLLIVANKNS